MFRRIIHIDEEKCDGCGCPRRAVEAAVKASSRFIPRQAVIISRDGHISK